MEEGMRTFPPRLPTAAELKGGADAGPVRRAGFPPRLPTAAELKAGLCPIRRAAEAGFPPRLPTAAELKAPPARNTYPSPAGISSAVTHRGRIEGHPLRVDGRGDGAFPPRLPTAA